jgi:hypothetical protein
MNKKIKLEENEEHAFYESGLSAHGCLEKLDDYDIRAIMTYGRILLKMKKTITIDWPIVGMICILSSTMGIIGFSEYLTYLSNKEKYNAIQMAISKDWSNEQIQGLLNTTKNEN